MNLHRVGITASAQSRMTRALHSKRGKKLIADCSRAADPPISHVRNGDHAGPQHAARPEGPTAYAAFLGDEMWGNVDPAGRLRAIVQQGLGFHDVDTALGAKRQDP